MSEITRRSFFGGALSISAVAMLPALALVDEIPEIYGDMVHDDTEGLQALFDGRPFKVNGDGFQASCDGIAILMGGTFLVSRTLHIGKIQAHVEGVYFENAGAPVESVINLVSTGSRNYIGLDGRRI